MCRGVAVRACNGEGERSVRVGSVDRVCPPTVCSSQGTPPTPGLPLGHCETPKTVTANRSLKSISKGCVPIRSEGNGEGRASVRGAAARYSSAPRLAPQYPKAACPSGAQGTGRAPLCLRRSSQLFVRTATSSPSNRLRAELAGGTPFPSTGWARSRSQISVARRANRFRR